MPGEWIWALVFPALVAFAVAVLPEAQRFGLDERLRRPWTTGCEAARTPVAR